MPYYNGKGEKIADTNKQYEEYKLNVRFWELSERIKVLEEILKKQITNDIQGKDTNNT